MIQKRLWTALIICACLVTVLVMGAERSRRANAAGVIDPSCTSSSPCIEYDNNGSGPGIRGISLGGNGLAGATNFNSTSSTNAREGLIGNDISTSGSFNAGVRGLSVRGVGVAGQSTNNAGVQGNSTNNNGVFGDSQSGAASGVYGQNDGGGYGVAGRVTKNFSLAAILADAGSTGASALEADSQNGIGVFATTGSASEAVLPFESAVIALDKSTGGLIGVDAISNQGTALVATSAGPQVAFQVEAVGAGNLMVGVNNSSQIVMRLDGAGNMHAHSFTADLTATTGQKLVSYTPRASEPTIEDFGEAQLSNGSAYVRLEPRFASTMARGLSYLVFITPEGDNRGLYVTQKTPAGFAVRECQGGHSMLAFSYRIVAKPFGSHEARLPVVELPKLRTIPPYKQTRRFRP
jgi:hypothetical protein